ncbi:TPA: hypothetical protein ENS27_14870 [bacterium]|nr:hypothetical protein [bacterium]
MCRRYFIASVAIMLIITSLAFAQVDKIAIFYEQVGWIAADPAKKAGDAIVKGVTKGVNNIKVYNDADIGAFAKANTKDGDFDIIVTFGYFPVSLYKPGNAEKDGSLAENFLNGGDMILNTADYIFYVTQGGGANGDTGLKNITNSNFDCWTDGTTCKPTADGKKYAPSLPASFTAPRCLKKDQIQASTDWVVEMIFADNGANNMDPVIIRNKKTGGRVGIAFQVADDSQPRDKVLPEIIQNYIVANVTAVKPAEKATATWGQIKGF